MVSAAERRARMALACVSEPGEPGLSALVSERGGLEVWDAVRRRQDSPVWSRRVAGLDLPAVEAATEAAGARFVVPGDPEWPAGLADLAGAEELSDRGGVPIGLWVRGAESLARLTQRSVAVVGSRAATSYGQGVAADLAAELCASGVSVLSGGAFGIDAAAHRGALAGSGSSRASGADGSGGAAVGTLAVMASGVDVVYPRGNAGLLEEVARRGLIVSEHPPGEHPTRIRFLGRNRLIAALSQACVVVEATARSGARNTAAWAQRCGRVVAAVPGSVHSAQSVTPHRLIATAEASLITSAADLLGLLAPLQTTLPPPPAHHQRRVMDGWDPLAVAVREVLPARGTLTAGEVSLRSRRELPDCLAALAWLEQEGQVECRTDGGWALMRP